MDISRNVVSALTDWLPLLTGVPADTVCGTANYSRLPPAAVQHAASSVLPYAGHPVLQAAPAHTFLDA